MTNDGKDNEARGDDASDGGAAPGAHANGTSSVPGAAQFTRAVCEELADVLEGVGAELQRLGSGFCATGGLIRTAEGSAVAAVIRGLHVEIRFARDTLTHIDINLPGRP